MGGYRMVTTQGNVYTLDDDGAVVQADIVHDELVGP